MSLRNMSLLALCALAALATMPIQVQADVSPIAFWSLNENPIASGTTAVDSVGGYNLTYGPGSVASATGVWGVSNTAVHLGGDNTGGSFVSGAIPTGGIVYSLYATGYTVEAFFELDTNLGTGVEGGIYNEGQLGFNQGTVMGLEVKPGNQIDFQVLKPSIWWAQAQLASAPLSTGTWYYAAGSCLYDSGSDTTTVSVSLYDPTGRCSWRTSSNYTGTPTGAVVSGAMIGAGASTATT